MNPVDFTEFLRQIAGTQPGQHGIHNNWFEEPDAREKVASEPTPGTWQIKHPMKPGVSMKVQAVTASVAQQMAFECWGIKAS